MTVTEATALLSAGRKALADRDWNVARAHFAAVNAVRECGAAWEGIGHAAWRSQHAAECLEARERAYRCYREEGDDRGAARVATALAFDVIAVRGDFAVARGWIGRARRLVDGLGPVPEAGWLAVREGSMVLGSDGERALALGTEATTAGRTLGLLDLEMVGLSLEGLALVGLGRIDEGMARLDESSAAAVSGEMEDPFAIGLTCCHLIYACERVRDYDRAGQWCRRLDEQCEQWQLAGLQGVCRVHYAGVLVSDGRWEEAEAELQAATAALERLAPGRVREGLSRLGELRRRQGRLDEATELFERAGPNPLALVGRAAVSLDRGEARDAADHAERFLRGLAPVGRLERAPGLEVLARAALALGDRGRAAAALEELHAIAAKVGTEPLAAAALATAGLAAAAAGDHDAARAALEDAVDQYAHAQMPYEAAVARLDLAAALSALGRGDAAERERRAARAALSDLGAAPPAPAPSPPAGTLTPREREVLALVAEGASNAQVAERLVVSEHTVHRHVANILTKLGVSSRTAAVTSAARRGLL